MNISFTKVKWQQDAEGCWLSVLVDSPIKAKKFCAEKKDKKYVAEIKRFREKRSLDANAYLWALVGAMADVLRTDKDSVYVLMLKRYGQGGVAKIQNQDVDLFCRTYKYHEPHESLPPEERAQYFRFWIGSSEYNSAEMSILIDGVIDECKNLGIDTMTPDEISLMIEAWRR